MFSYTKSENRRAEQVLSVGLVPVEWGGCVEKVLESEDSANTVYTCM
jgi:hypothetical protein